MRRLTQIFLVLALFQSASTPGVGQEVEFGLTPGTVYGVWSNINKALIAYAGERSADEKWLRDLETMAPDTFSDKVPANVLERVKLFRSRLNELRNGGEVTAALSLLEGNLPLLLAEGEGNQVTPSLVYLHSGQVLTMIAQDIVETSATGGIEISPFFDMEIFTGKTPSDVFGLVDLGARRLDEILARQKAGELMSVKGSR